MPPNPTTRDLWMTRIRLACGAGILVASCGHLIWKAYGQDTSVPAPSRPAWISAMNTYQPLETTNIMFGPGIVIDGKTGNVTIPKGVPMDDASRVFWKTLTDVYPDFRRGICKP